MRYLFFSTARIPNQSQSNYKQNFILSFHIDVPEGA
jgi:hypothetical protein